MLLGVSTRLKAKPKSFLDLLRFGSLVILSVPLTHLDRAEGTRHHPVAWKGESLW